jgi:hypothetical protein
VILELKHKYLVAFVTISTFFIFIVLFFSETNDSIYSFRQQSGNLNESGNPSDKTSTNLVSGKRVITPDGRRPPEKNSSRLKFREDYQKMREMLISMEPIERLIFLRGAFLKIQSDHSNKFDYEQKIKLIDEFGGSDAANIKKQLLKTIGFRLDKNADQDLICEINLSDFESLIGSAAQQNAMNAFEAAATLLNEERRNLGCTLVMNIWMNMDSIAASKYVAEMPRGNLKDSTVCNMIDWLIQHGGENDAKMWVSEIGSEMVAFEMRKRIYGSKKSGN